jgi:hypothetical protein
MHYFLKPAGRRPEQCDRREASGESDGRCEQAAIGCSFELIHDLIPSLAAVVKSGPPNVAIQAATVIYAKPAIHLMILVCPFLLSIHA